MKRLYLALWLVLCMVVTALPAHAATETFHSRVGELFAQARFESSGPCVDTFVFVVAKDDVVHDSIGFPGHPVPVSEAIVSIYQFDNCAGTTVFSGDGTATLPDTAFQIDKKFTSATLNATVEVFEFYTETVVPVDVSMTWTGSDSAVRQLLRVRDETPGLKSTFTAVGEARDAAVSGSVLIAGTNIITPDPSNYALLGSVKVGRLEIAHGSTVGGATVGGPLPSSPTSTSSPWQDNLLAEAFFLSSSGLCPEQDTTIYVGILKDVFRQGDSSAPNQAYVSVARFTCDGFLVSDYEGLVTLPDTAFQIDKNLKSASLNATIEVTDIDSGASASEDVSMTWTAKDLAWKDRTHGRIWTLGSKNLCNLKDTAWNADTSGSVRLGGTNLPLESQYFARIESAKVYLEGPPAACGVPG